MANPKQIATKTAEEIREDYLRTIKQGLINLGIQEPNVSAGTLDYVRGTALGQFGALLYLNVDLKADAQMADTAQGEDLIRIAKIYNLSLRSAGISSGNLILSSTVATSIAVPTGSQLIDDTGLSYQVSVGGSYFNEDEIPIDSIDTGSITNLAAGSTLRWVSPPPFVSKTALVSEGGLTGGVDDETIEGLRTRVLEKIRNPPGGGNFSQLNDAAESSTVSVQKAFTYPAANGPATAHVAVITAATEADKTRDVNSLVLSTKIAPAVQAIIPESMEILTTTVQNQTADVAIGITIPAATNASPAGQGGGWTDATPWPTIAAGYCRVTFVSTTTDFTVESEGEPIPGVTQICWLSPITWKLYTATITGFTGTAPNCLITIDTPFPNIAVGHYICPNAESAQDYFNSLLSAFNNLGPGQKTALAGLLPRAYRRPLVTESWPSDLNSQVLRRLTDDNDTIAAANFNYRSVTTPSIPALITDGPYILVPGNLGFYPLAE